MPKRRLQDVDAQIDKKRQVFTLDRVFPWYKTTLEDAQHFNPNAVQDSIAEEELRKGFADIRTKSTSCTSMSKLQLPDISAQVKKKHRDFTFEEVSPWFGTPLKEATQNFNMCITVFKKRCGALGIERWPYRKVKSVKANLHRCKGKDSSTHKYLEMQLNDLHTPNYYKPANCKHKQGTVHNAPRSNNPSHLTFSYYPMQKTVARKIPSICKILDVIWKQGSQKSAWEPINSFRVYMNCFHQLTPTLTSFTSLHLYAR